MMIWDQGGYDEPDMYQVTRQKSMQSSVEIRGERQLGRPECR
jgi:hypothetical protein